MIGSTIAQMVSRSSTSPRASFVSGSPTIRVGRKPASLAIAALTACWTGCAGYTQEGAAILGPYIAFAFLSALRSVEKIESICNVRYRYIKVKPYVHGTYIYRQKFPCRPQAPVHQGRSRSCFGEC